MKCLVHYQQNILRKYIIKNNVKRKCVEKREGESPYNKHTGFVIDIFFSPSSKVQKILVKKYNKISTYWPLNVVFFLKR